MPVIVKPVDAAGSKGVTKVSKWDELESAIDWAIKYSFSGDFIIESFIEKKGCSSDCDCFSVDGQFKFISFSAQRFDEKAAGEYTPAAYSWPSTLGKEAEEELSKETGLTPVRDAMFAGCEEEGLVYLFVLFSFI